MKRREKQLKKGFFGWDDLNGFFKRWCGSFFLHLQEFFHFLHLIHAQKLKDTFDRMPGADGYVRLNLLIAARTKHVNIKLTSRTLLMFINPWERFPKRCTCRESWDYCLSEVRAKWSSWTVPGTYGTSSAVTKNVSRQAASMIDEMGQTLWRYTQMWWVKGLKAFSRLVRTRIAELRLSHNLVQNSRQEEKHK